MKAVLWLGWCLVALLGTCSGRKAKYEWTRRVTPYLGREKVVTNETAVVKSTRKEMTVTMTADDPELYHTQYYRARTIHDFKTGLLAMIPEGTRRCYLGRVFNKTFVDTERELRRRQAGAAPTSVMRPMSIDTGRVVKKSGSKVLDRQCKQGYFRVTDLPSFPILLFPWYPPFWCIYGPIYIIYIRIRTVPVASKWKGGFGPQF